MLNIKRKKQNMPFKTLIRVINPGDFVKKTQIRLKSYYCSI
jgi:hypothetical protein